MNNRSGVRQLENSFWGYVLMTLSNSSDFVAVLHCSSAGQEVLNQAPCGANRGHVHGPRCGPRGPQPQTPFGRWQLGLLPLLLGQGMANDRTERLTHSSVKVSEQRSNESLGGCSGEVLDF